MGRERCSQPFIAVSNNIQLRIIVNNSGLYYLDIKVLFIGIEFA